MYNICFGAGPAAQNQTALNQLSCMIKDKPSLLEMSHRSNEFQTYLNKTKSALRTLLDVPDEMEILFLSGGASFQFLMIPENCLNKKAGYVITGLFSRSAYEAGCRYGQCDVLYDHRDHPYDLSDFPNEINGDYDYVHICLNNSVYGTKTPDFVCDCPVIADVSSILGIENIDFSRFSMCYASAQKNFGISGMTLVFIRKDLQFSTTYPLISYRAQMEADSLLNTPPILSIVMCFFVVNELLKRKETLYLENQMKASMFYEFLDTQDVFIPLVKEHRSMMNCTFKMKTYDDEQHLLNECERHGIKGLKGHRQTGHLRVNFSAHNTMEEVMMLIELMKKL